MEDSQVCLLSHRQASLNFYLYDLPDPFKYNLNHQLSTIHLGVSGNGLGTLITTGTMSSSSSFCQLPLHSDWPETEPDVDERPSSIFFIAFKIFILGPTLVTSVCRAFSVRQDSTSPSTPSSIKISIVIA